LHRHDSQSSDYRARLQRQGLTTSPPRGPYSSCPAGYVVRPLLRYTQPPTRGGRPAMADRAAYAGPRLLDGPRTAHLVLTAAEFSDDAETIDGLARSNVTAGVLRKIARNPATAGHTLEYLIDIDQRSMTYPVTRRTDVTAGFIDRIARRLT